MPQNIKIVPISDYDAAALPRAASSRCLMDNSSPGPPASSRARWRAPIAAEFCHV